MLLSQLHLGLALVIDMFVLHQDSVGENLHMSNKQNIWVPCLSQLEALSAR